MLISLLIMIIFIMHRVIQTETIYVPRGTGGDYMCVIEGDDELLYVVREWEEVECFVVDGVVDEDVLLLVDCQEMSPMTVLN